MNDRKPCGKLTPAGAAAAGAAAKLPLVNPQAAPPPLRVAETVPVLVLPDGRVIEQSLEVMLHALKARDADGWLQPTDGTLEQMLAGYQRGAVLLNFCRTRLEAVQEQIKVLDEGALQPWTQE